VGLFDAVAVGGRTRITLRVSCREGICCYVTCKAHVEETPELLVALRNQIRKLIGPFAAPDLIVITPVRAARRDGARFAAARRGAARRGAAWPASAAGAACGMGFS
jgi:hypothetical protein